jgi:hypothetical protein
MVTALGVLDGAKLLIVELRTKAFAFTKTVFYLAAKRVEERRLPLPWARAVKAAWSRAAESPLPGSLA